MGKLVIPALNTVGNENNTACGLIDPNYQTENHCWDKEFGAKKRLKSLVMGVFLVKNHSLKQKKSIW